MPRALARKVVREVAQFTQLRGPAAVSVASELAMIGALIVLGLVVLGCVLFMQWIDMGGRDE